MEIEFAPNGEAVRCSTCAPRSLLCGTGVRFDCVMAIDGRAGTRACAKLVRRGMRVQTQHGSSGIAAPR